MHIRSNYSKSVKHLLMTIRSEREINQRKWQNRTEYYRKQTFASRSMKGEIKGKFG